MIEFLTPDQAYDKMSDDAEELTDANYHSEASGLWAQAEAMQQAVRQGRPLGYFSWGGNDIVGLTECVLVRE